MTEESAQHHARTAGGDAVTVLHVTTIDASLDLLLLPQLTAFRDAGLSIHTASALGPHVARLEAAGLVHHPLPHATRAPDPVADLRTLIDLVRLMRRLRPAIVHTHTPKMGVLGRLAARLARIPHVVNTVHGLWAAPDDPWPRRVMVYTVERVAAALSDVELVQNEEDLATLERLGVPKRRLVLLGNGIDLHRFDLARVPGARESVRAELGVAADEVLVGFVGRLVGEKGLPELIEVARRLAGTPTRFVLVGPDEPDKSDRFDRLRLPKNVVAVGMRDDVERWYAAFDVVVLPSRREGFPRVPMEAAAMGVPVVATDVRGCRQAIRDGVTGLLVPARDADRLEAAVRHLVTDPAARRGLGTAARRHAAETFDVSVQIQRTLDAYRGLLGHD